MNFFCHRKLTDSKGFIKTIVISGVSVKLASTIGFRVFLKADIHLRYPP